MGISRNLYRGAKEVDHSRIVRGENVQWHKNFKTKQAEKEYLENTDEERKLVENEFLTPQTENFVETQQVKDLEHRILLWIKLGYPIHLVGPTGCGKTTLAMNVAKSLGRPVVWINGDESVTTADLIGGYSQIEQQTVRDRFIHNVYKDLDIMKADWQDNPLTLACKFGYTLVYNEFSRSRAAANNVLLSVFEEKILELPTMFGGERYVKVHPNFNAIMTSNSVEYAGIHRPQDALLDRMIGIHMDFYDKDTEVEIIKAHAKISESEAEKIVNIVRGLRGKVSVGERPGTRAAVMVAQGLESLIANGGCSKTDFEQLVMDSIANKTISFEDQLKKAGLIKNILLEKTN